MLEHAPPSAPAPAEGALAAPASGPAAPAAANHAAAATWPLSFTLNGGTVQVDVDPTDTLFTVLRRELRHTGTKGACLEGECGSCTVLVDGVPQTSCLILAPQAQGCAVTTVEGLAEGSTLSPVQEAFAACGASQCGYCIPGFLVAATAFLEECPEPTRDEIRRGLEGNICRCTGYMKIVEAVQAAGASARRAP